MKIWVRSTALAIIYFYHYQDEHTITVDEIIEYFGMSEKKSEALLKIFNLKDILPDRKYLLSWVDQNSGKYEDHKSRDLLRAEKLYWDKKFRQENGLLTSNIDHSDYVSPEKICSELSAAISKVKIVEPAVKATRYNDNTIKEILDHMNRLIINANRAISILAKCT